MKLSELKNIMKDAVKEAIREEMKEILLEAIRVPKHTIYENNFKSPQPHIENPIPSSPSMISRTSEELRESYRNILGETALSLNSGNVGQPLQLSGNMDTSSPNGSLPQGEVGMDMIMGLMKGKI